ncbi:MAG: hypothetical protein DLM70_01710 [Chloroflexi bacterium]|nr:MAG: hypothetical protein DLM70_01710 [Chloroflexota bacterium]
MSQKYRTNLFFNGVSSFKAAFPQLDDALIEWRELRGPEDERQTEMRRTGHKRGNFNQGVLPCGNSVCHEGGYQLDRLINHMLVLEEMEREGTLLCSGREVGEEVKRGPVRCPHRIHFKVKLVPRGEGSAPGDGQRRSRGRNRRRRPAA